MVVLQLILWAAKTVVGCRLASEQLQLVVGYPDRLGSALAFKRGSSLFLNFLLALSNQHWMNAGLIANLGNCLHPSQCP